MPNNEDEKMSTMETDMYFSQANIFFFFPHTPMMQLNKSLMLVLYLTEPRLLKYLNANFDLEFVCPTC